MARVNLAASLSSAFDAEPQTLLALRVRHADGATWRVADETLVLEAGVLFWGTSLDGHTLGSLATAITDAGFDVAYLNADIAHLSAGVLLEGAGDQADSNGDHLYAYMDVWSVLLQALGRSSAAGRDAIPAALSQLILPDATAEWADLFGEVFGVSRPSGFADGDYTQHILAEVGRARDNPAAMQRNLMRWFGLDIVIREPWKEIFFVSDPNRPTRLSGAAHLQGAPVYQYHTIQPVAASGVVWDGILDQVRADCPAGTVILDPVVVLPVLIEAGFDDHPLLAYNRDAIRNTNVFWNTYSWATGGWNTRHWGENSRVILLTGLPGS